MARGTIKQRIALDGGEEIKAELEAIGRVGEVAFKKLQAAAKQEIVPSPFLARLQSLKKAFADVGTAAAATGPGFRQLGAGLTGLRSGVDTVVGRVGLLSAAVTGVVVGIGALVKSAAEGADALQENAQKAGLTVEQFQRLAFVAKTAGVGPEELARAFQHLNKELTTNGDILKNISGGLAPVKDVAARIKEGFSGAGQTVSRFGKAADETKDKALDFATAMGRLKINVEEFKKLDNEGKALKLIEAFEGISNEAEVAALSVGLFGSKAGLVMVPLLKQGSDGVKELVARLKDLGIGLNQQQLTGLGGLADETDLLGEALTDLKKQIVAVFAPSITAGIGEFLLFLRDNRQAVLDFAETIRVQAVQAVKDLFAVFQGREGDVKNQWVLDLSKNLTTIKDFITDQLIPAFVSFFGILGQAAAAINSVFNTNLSAEGLAIVLVIAQLTGAFGLIVPAVQTVIGAFRILIALLTAGPWGIVAVAAVAAVTLIVAHWSELTEFFRGLFAGIADLAKGFGQAIVSALAPVFDTIRSIVSAVASAIQSVRDLAAAGGSVNQGGTGGTPEGGMGFTSGGRVRGPGTGTSDSIRARLSNGEFVVNAKAVRRYGAEFFSALNAMRLNPPKYAMGGLVQAPTFKLGLPAFAGGGLAQASSAMHPINLHIDGRTVPVQGSANAAAQLMAIAQRRTLASGGRKPSR